MWNCYRLILCIASLSMVSGMPLVAQERPNVLFIAIDDLNDWLGCTGGHPNAITPNIDRLAERGMLFTNAHCQAPICGPSRASLFTGLLPTTTGIYGQISDKRLTQASGVTASATMLPDYFEQHGYKTLAAGKLFHNGDSAGYFQEYGAPSSFGPKPEKRFKYDPAWFPEKIGSTQTDWGAYPETDALMPDFKIAEYGVQQLAQEHTKPFFLAVGFMRPHVPWYVPQKWFDMHPLDAIELPPYLEDDFADIPLQSQRVNELPAMPTTRWAIENNEWKNIVQAYLACTTFVDAQVGKVLDALANSPHADNTIVILWSDHGYHIGEKNRFAKQALWDRATKMPLIIAQPNSVAVGVCNQPVGLIDLYPTLVAMCGLPANPDNEGHSIQPLLENPKAAWPHLTLTSYGRHNHALQSERFRFYQYQNGSQELYDHLADPNEWHNVAREAEYADTIAAMQSALPLSPARVGRHVTYPTNAYFIDLAEQESAGATPAPPKKKRSAGN